MPDEIVKLCECGCGEPVGSRRGRPSRFRQGHNFRIPGPLYLADDSTGCWIWQRGRDSLGYGRIWVEGRCWVAHRYVYERELGPIPAGHELDHECRNPSCVNPAHLRPATHAENHQNRAASRNGRPRGVSYDKGMRQWLAHVTVRGVLHRLGYYSTAEDAGEVASAFRAQHMPFSEDAKRAPADAKARCAQRREES